MRVIKTIAKKETIWTKGFVMIFFINVFCALGFHILTPILPKYTISLGYNNTVAGVVSTVFTITSILVRPMLLKINLNGRYRYFLMGSLGIIAIAIAGFSISNQAGMLIAFRLIQGVGWAVCTSVTATLATLALPSSRVGAGIGVFGLASVFGSAIAPNLGLTLVDAIGYTPTFIIALCMPICGIMLCLLMGNLECSQQGVQKRARSTVLAFGDIDWKPLYPTLLLTLAMIPAQSIGAFLALYAETKGVENIGYFFTVNAFSLFFTRPLYGRLSDRLKPWQILLPSFVAYIVLLLAIRSANSLIAFLVIALLYGLCYGGVKPTIQSWCVREVKAEQYTTAHIIFYTGIDVAAGLGGVIAGAVATVVGYSDMYLWMTTPVILAIVVLMVPTVMNRNRGKSAVN